MLTTTAAAEKVVALLLVELLLCGHGRTVGAPTPRAATADGGTSAVAASAWRRSLSLPEPSRCSLPLGLPSAGLRVLQIRIVQRMWEMWALRTCCSLTPSSRPGRPSSRPMVFSKNGRCRRGSLLSFRLSG
eukprot:5838051-Pyramimonas_sp.AAC.1